MVMTRFQKEKEKRSGEHLTVRLEAGDLERRRPPQAEETKVKLERYLRVIVRSTLLFCFTQIIYILLTNFFFFFFFKFGRFFELTDLGPYINMCNFYI